MATIEWPEATRGSTRPYGYTKQVTQSGVGSRIIGVPSDVVSIGVQIGGLTGGYFLEGTLFPQTAVEGGTAEWMDLLGDGSTAQTTAQQVALEGGFFAIRLRIATAGYAATAYVEMRRA